MRMFWQKLLKRKLYSIRKKIFILNRKYFLYEKTCGFNPHFETFGKVKPKIANFIFIEDSKVGRPKLEVGRKLRTENC